MKKTVSIITVTFNAEDYLEETILSVVNQKYENIEYIIIDGGSTDKTIDIIKKYEDNIDYWISEKDSGIYDAMNKGILVANGKWLNFLNGGDRYYNQDVLSDIFERENIMQYDLIYGDCYFISQKNDLLREFKAEVLNKRSVEKGMVVNHQAIFIKREKAPLYDLKYRYKAEWNWLIDIVYEQKKLNMHYVNFPIVYYKLGGFSYQWFHEDFKEYIKIKKKRFGSLSLVKDILFIMRIWVGYYVRQILSIETLRRLK